MTEINQQQAFWQRVWDTHTLSSELCTLWQVGIGQLADWHGKETLPEDKMQQAMEFMAAKLQ